MRYQLVCGAANPCGFRVDDEYFERKRRFQAGICPRCNAPLKCVEAWTNKEVAFTIVTDPGARNAGEVTVLPTPTISS